MSINREVELDCREDRKWRAAINSRHESVTSSNELQPRRVISGAGPTTSASKPRRISMKTIIASALITLSLVTAIAAPASAFDAKEFWEQQDRSHY